MDERDFPAPAQEDTIIEKSSPETGGGDNPAEWELSESLCGALHDGVLYASLEALAKNPYTEEAMDVLQWVFGKDYPLQPFSFKACCLFANLDAEALREALVPVFHAVCQEKAWKACKSRKGRMIGLDPVTGIRADMQRILGVMQAIASGERRCE